MAVLFSFAALIMVLPLVAYYLSGFGSSSGVELLEASFATQQATIHGRTMPASDLLVVHQWRANAMTDRWGKILAIDANWLCRTSDGLFVVAIGQSGEERAERSLVPRKLLPQDIHWVWRSVSEERVRQMLTGTPRTYRKIFGSPVVKS